MFYAKCSDNFIPIEKFSVSGSFDKPVWPQKRKLSQWLSTLNQLPPKTKLNALPLLAIAILGYKGLSFTLLEAKVALQWQGYK